MGGGVWLERDWAEPKSGGNSAHQGPGCLELRPSQQAAQSSAIGTVPPQLNDRILWNILNFCRKLTLPLSDFSGEADNSSSSNIQPSLVS